MSKNENVQKLKPSFVADLFPEEFADHASSVKRIVVVNSKGGTAVDLLGNVDSSGQIITHSQQALENFWNTFDGTHAIDDEGRPLRLYHSTGRDITAFELGHESTNNYGLLGDVTVNRAGIFLTPDVDFSQEYLPEGDGQNVMPVYLNLQQPLDLRDGITHEIEQDLERAGISTRFLINTPTYWELFDNDSDNTNEFVQILKDNGYDGAIFYEDRPSGEGEPGTTYVAFSPEQIKSATGNRGTFDPKTTDIRYSRTGQANAPAVKTPLTQTEQFKQWFGKSQIVNDKGEPLVVYHGTDRDFDSFILPGNKTGRMSGGKAIFFAANPKTSNAFARYEGARTLPVHLRIEKLFDFSDEATMAKFEKFLRKNFDSVAPGALYGPDSAMSMLKNGDYGLLEQPATIAWMKRNGYDGMRLIERQGEVTYAVFKPDQIKSAIGNNGDFDRSNPDIRYSFGGSFALTADIASLEHANKMAKDGKSAGLIQRETGWHRGVDGQWRFEISDDKAAFYDVEPVDLARLADEIKGEVSYEASGGLIKAKYKPESDDYLGAFGHTEQHALMNLAMHKSRQMSRGFNVKHVKNGDIYNLEQVLDHPELFAAYPFLKLIPVHFIRGGDPNERGAYYERSFRMELNADRPPEDVLSTLLHEVQHAIQGREDFARGGNSDMAFSESIKKLLQTMSEDEARRVEMWKLNNQSLLEDAERASVLARNALKFESVKRLISYGSRDKPSGVFRLIRQEMQWIYDEEFHGNDGARELQRLFYDMPKSGPKRNAYIRDMAYDAAQFIRASIPVDHLEQFIGDKRTTKGMINALRRQSDAARDKLKPLREQEAKATSVEHLFNQSRRKSAYEIYRSLAGEVEARTTQARQHLTAEERRNRPVINDMDVSPAEAIVVVGGMELIAPFAKDSAAATREAAISDFNDWFKGSKAVDHTGKPLVVYHGSFSDIEAFRPGDHGSMMGRAIYLSSNPEDASRYASADSSINFDITGKAERLAKELDIQYKDARGIVTQGNGVVYPLYVDIKNPLVIGKNKLDATHPEFMLAAAEADVEREEAERLFRRWKKAPSGIEQFSVLTHPNVYRGLATIQGHDGIIMRDGLAPTTSALRGDTEHYIAFWPEQVRSAIGFAGDLGLQKETVQFKQNSGHGLLKSQVEEMVAGIKTSWSNAPDIHIVQSTKDMPVKVVSDAAGAFYNGAVYLIADNLKSRKQAEFVLMHEVVGHYGLAGVLGDKLDQTMLNIYRDNADVRSQADAWMNRYGSNNAALATEEVLSDYAADFTELTGWKKLAATLRKAARQIGFKVSMADQDISLLLQDSRKFVELGNHVSTVSALTAKYRRATSNTADAFTRWFGGSKVIDDQGQPKAVYHGGGADLSAFRTEGSSGKTFGTGAFFSSSPAVASTYSTGVDGGTVYPVYLNLLTPAVFDAGGANWSRLGKSTRVELPAVEVSDQEDEDLLADLFGRPATQGVTRKVKARSTTLGRLFPDDMKYEDDYLSTDDLARWARKNGYDGVIINNVCDRGPSGLLSTEAAKDASTIYVCFHPQQIKSAIGNNGAFDPNNPDIRYSRTQDRQEPAARKLVDESAGPGL